MRTMIEELHSRLSECAKASSNGNHVVFFTPCKNVSVDCIARLLRNFCSSIEFKYNSFDEVDEFVHIDTGGTIHVMQFDQMNEQQKLADRFNLIYVSHHPGLC